MAKPNGLVRIAKALLGSTRGLEFQSPVSYVYNPLDYARAPHERYLERYGSAQREVILVGMNPGPWGMAQTGIPFGEVGIAKDWLRLAGPVGKPKREHPRRPVQGFDCPRREVSGARLWGWARDGFVTPERFFRRFFVTNYCPLCFLEEGGRNITPDKLPAAERRRLFEPCDLALRDTVLHLNPRIVIGIGRFAEQRVRAALDGLDVEIGHLLHPSPASPAANRGWAAPATKSLAEYGITLPSSRRAGPPESH